MSNSRRPSVRRQRGLTLVEIMMVLVVVAIITVVAVPAYQKFTRDAKRSEGRAVLLERASRMQRYKDNNGSFALSASEETNVERASERGYYQVAYTNLNSGDGFNLAATAQGFTDSSCGTLTIDHLGRRGPAGCWE